jgi:UDP-glucose 4-epimerase
MIWKGKQVERINGKILVTGGAGFIGSHLCERLLDQGYDVIAIDNLSTGCMENIDHLRLASRDPGYPHFQFIHDTIMNPMILDRLTSQAHTIIHLAAAVGVKLIIQDPVHTIRTNIMGTEAILDAANRYGCQVLLASTSEVYGKGVKVPFHEDDDSLLGSTDHSRWAYAASKIVDEFLGLAYHQQFNLPVIVARLFNTIGPRQTGQYGMVVPRFVQQALRAEPLTVYGDGLQSRCFTDVRDVVDAIARLIAQPQAVGQVVNIGSKEEITILGLAQRVIALTSSRSEIQFVPYSKAYAAGFDDMRRRIPALETIEKLIDYRPRYSLDDALLQVISYERIDNSTRK